MKKHRGRSRESSRKRYNDHRYRPTFSKSPISERSHNFFHIDKNDIEYEKLYLEGKSVHEVRKKIRKEIENLKSKAYKQRGPSKSKSRSRSSVNQTCNSIELGSLNESRNYESEEFDRYSNTSNTPMDQSVHDPKEEKISKFDLQSALKMKKHISNPISRLNESAQACHMQLNFQFHRINDEVMCGHKM